MNKTESNNAAVKSAKDDIFAARKCENINDPIDTHIIDYIAIFFTKIFIKLHIVPNAVTVFSMVSGITGCVLLAFPELGLNIIGAFLVMMSAVFDACDGQVARLTKHFSRFGRILDGFSDGSVYFSLYAVCVFRLWGRSPFDHALIWQIAIIVSAVLAFILYIIQSQLPDYFKNLHMFMIDNSHGNELSRAKNVKKEYLSAPKFSFDRFILFNYYNYTNAQEKRAPKTQKMLDEIEKHGKSDELREAFYKKSRRLVMLTNLMTFNLRTAVLLVSVFLHMEYIGLLFDIVILEPIRLILLKKYEDLSGSLLKLL